MRLIRLAATRRPLARSALLLALALGAAFWPVVLAGGAEDVPVTGTVAARLGEPTLTLVTEIVRRMRIRDCDIAVCDDDGVPLGWHSLSGGLHLHLTENGRAADVWALPADWVAVRTMAPAFSNGRSSGIITVGGVRWATMHDDISNRFFERFRDTSPAPNLAALRVQDRRPPMKTWLPEQVAQQTAAARASLSRYCVRAGERAMGIRSLAELGVPAHELYRELAQDPDGRVREAAISVMVFISDDSTISFLGTQLNREVAAPEQRETRCQVARVLRETADPASIPSLLAALGHVEDQETVFLVVATLAILQCQESSPLILKRLREETDTARRATYAKALATLRVPAALPLIRDLLPDAAIMGKDLAREMYGATYPSPMLSYLKLTASWSRTVDHARIMLLPWEHQVPLGKGCVVTLLIESCGAPITSIFYLDGVVTVDGVEHRHFVGPAIGCFTVMPGDVGQHQLDLSTYIGAPGIHRIGYRCDDHVADAIDIEVAAP